MPSPGSWRSRPREEKRWHLFGYTDRMGEAMAAADAIVSRAGATSLAEISARGHPGAARAVPVRHGGPPDHERPRLRGGGLRVHAGRRRCGGAGVRAARALASRRRGRARERMAAAARAQKTADAAAKLADVVMGGRAVAERWLPWKRTRGNGQLRMIMDTQRIRIGPLHRRGRGGHERHRTRRLRPGPARERRRTSRRAATPSS